MYTSKDILPLMLLGATGVIAYLFLKNKEEKDRQTALQAANLATAKANNAVTAQSNGTSAPAKANILSDAEIKRYATWIDRVEQLTTINPLTSIAQLEQTAEAKGNLQALINLDDYNLRLVVKYWEDVRKRSIRNHKTFAGFVLDVSGLVAKLQIRL